jgi:tetratricopeptide (TPR) repeat protein
MSMRNIPALAAIAAFAAGAVLAAERQDRPATARIGILDSARYNLYASPKDLPIAKAINEGERLYKAEEFAKAQAAFNALQAMPGAAAIRNWAACMEAMSLANQEKYDDARALLKKVLDADQKSDDANLADYAYGATCKLAYEDDKAVACYDKYLDNPDRRRDTNYYDRALGWQTDQYRSRSTTNPGDAATKARFYHLLDMWVKAHPDSPNDYQLLYKHFRSQAKWAECLRVAGYKMKTADASISVLNDRLAWIQEKYPAAKIGTEEASKAATPLIVEFQADLAKEKAIAPEARRAIHFRLVQTFLLCGRPEEGDKAALEWMAANPGDRSAVYMYIGHVRAAKAARPDALDRIVRDFIATNPPDDIRMEALEMYAETAIPLYKDRSQIEKTLKENRAPASTMVTLYTGWKKDEAQASCELILSDTNTTDDARFRALMQLGDGHYEKGAVAQATNMYRQAIDSTAINRKFAADLERFRDRIAQEQFKEGRSSEALALFQININSRNTEYWTRANLFHARENIKSKDIRTLMNADQALRRILGQSTHGGPWELATNFSDVPAIRKMQEEAKALCQQNDIDLTQQPMDEAAWRARLMAKSKAEFDKRLKTM